MEPRIYVACLSSYNAGVLHGKWIDANQSADEIREEIASMLAESKHEPHEEHAIHDFEGFGGIKLSEYESIDRVAELGELLAEHGEAFAAYANYVGVDHATEEGFQEAFRGHYTSEEAFAEEFAEEVYGKELGPMAGYIDYEKYARDLFMGDLFSVDGDGGVYVFWNS